VLITPPELAWIAAAAGFGTEPVNEVTYTDREGHTVVTFLSDQVLAVAVALAESGASIGGKIRGCYSDAVGVSSDKASENYGQVDLGVWQISDRWHNEKLCRTGVNWRDPRDSAALAVEIHDDAGGWSPWSTFLSGSFKPFIEMALMAYRFPVPFRPSRFGGS